MPQKTLNGELPRGLFHTDAAAHAARQTGKGGIHQNEDNEEMCTTDDESNRGGDPGGRGPGFGEPGPRNWVHPAGDGRGSGTHALPSGSIRLGGQAGTPARHRESRA